MVVQSLGHHMVQQIIARFEETYHLLLIKKDFIHSTAKEKPFELAYKLPDVHKAVIFGSSILRPPNLRTGYVDLLCCKAFKMF